MLYTKNIKKVTIKKQRKISKKRKKHLEELQECLLDAILYKKPYNSYTKMLVFFAEEKRSCTFALQKRKNYAEKDSTRT